MLAIFAGISICSIYYFKSYFFPPKFNKIQGKGGLEMVVINYGREIDAAAKTFKISSAYLKALCMLESSGRYPVNPRYEKYIYTKLKLVKAGLLKKFEHVTSTHLKHANDEAIQNLSTSWGPFQLMGYKCMLMGINVIDIREDSSVYWGVKWIDMTYGNYLRKKQFSDAFHIHNTGQKVPSNKKPKTFDPLYISNGLKYMKYFEESSH